MSMIGLRKCYNNDGSKITLKGQTSALFRAGKDEAAAVTLHVALMGESRDESAK